MNQLTRFEPGYLSSNSGSIVLGVNELLTGKGNFVGGSEGLCGVAVDPTGNIYVSDSMKHVILKVDAGGRVSTYAGLAGTWGNNGASVVSGYNARFNDPGGIAVDRTGNVYVADRGNNQIRKIDTNRNVSLVAGSVAGTAGFTDGSGTAAAFNSPYDVAVDRTGNLWVADTSNHAVRHIRGPVVTTAAGDGTAGDVLGRGAISKLNKPYAVACDNSGFCFVADSGNFKIKAIDDKFFTHHWSGEGTKGWFIGSATTSSYQTLKYCDCDPAGNLYIISFDPDPGVKSRVLMVNRNGLPATIKEWTGDSEVIGVAVNNSGQLYVVESVDTEFNSSSSSSSVGTFSSSSSVGTLSSSSSSVATFSSSSQSSSSVSSSSVGTFSTSSSVGTKSSSSASSLSSVATFSSSSSSSSVGTFSSSSASSSVGTFSSSSVSSSSVSSSSASSLTASSLSSSSSVATKSSSSQLVFTLGADEQVDCDPDVSESYSITHSLVAGETAYVEVNGVNYQVANVAGAFVWDADNAQGGINTFGTPPPDETIARIAAGTAFDVIWQGSGVFVIDF